jgi:DMSO/TMAO reductase YedYZ molybdopterin-dependent catalytic subunit
MGKRLLSRRHLLIAGGGALATGAALLKWPLIRDPLSCQPLLNAGELFNMRAQRIALHGRPLAPQYRVDQISANHPTTGGFGALYVEPDPLYDQMAADRFSTWRLKVDGLIRRPLTLSLDHLRQMPSRTQITMHSCDEGWSAIGQWTGVPLAWLLAYAEVMPQARYVVFHCMDKIAGQQVYGSLDMLDAVHPQTIVAHNFNGTALPVRHGAPLRLRMELQIGYKQLKHIDRISIVNSLSSFGKGGGGLFEDYGYQWYAGL